MPIEFRCQRCQKLLRTPDNTAGKQAQCPQCGEVQAIPGAVAAPPAGSPPQPAAPVGGDAPPRNPFLSAPPVHGAGGNWGAPPGSYNPYQSPQPSLPPAMQPGPTRTRNGPPWESEGPSAGSFLNTIKAFFTDITGFFTSMRITGGIGLPLLYMMISSALGGFGYAVQQGVFSAMGVTMPGGVNNNAAGPDAAGAVVLIVAGSFCFAVFGALLGSFMMSAIHHLMLALFGGANHGFEATYRAVAYSYAHSYLLYLIPCCGTYIGGLASIPFTILGLAYAHDTSGWKAAGAVLLPMLACCVIGIGLVAALLSMAPG